MGHEIEKGFGDNVDADLIGRLHVKETATMPVDEIRYTAHQIGGVL
jgi:hypothetical protein